MRGRFMMVLTASFPAPQSVLDPASYYATEIQGLFALVAAISTVIFVLVEGLIVYCVCRFRQPASASRAEPPQIYGSKPIEVAWTVGPVLIVFVLFLVTIRTVASVRPRLEPDGALPITVIGHQWWWEFEYHELDSSGERRVAFRTANEIYIPTADPAAGKQRPIMLELKSVDVVHSFWVPRLGGKTDVFPGRTNRMWLEAAFPGTFHGQCAEYCGTQHANMLIRAVALPEDDYRQWWDKQKKTAAVDSAGDEGRRLFLSLACVNCHTVRGTSAAGRFAPDLTHLMSRQTLAAMPVANNRANLLSWVADPARIKPGAKMPSFQLSAAQLESIVAYLETLR